jgi:AcrR family transcriptional regulator
VRSASDLTAAAAIREAAMRLFAERGFAAVTVRQVAAAADVSPALVIHHFRSKDGLKAAVDQRALEAFAEMIADLISPESVLAEATTMAAIFAERLDAQPVLPAYLRRMLVDGGRQATALFRRLYQMSLDWMRDYEDAGVVRPTDDEPARAAFLLVNDLAVIMLRDQIAAVLGVDPLSRAGVERWTAQLMNVYTEGIYLPGKGPVT